MKGLGGKVGVHAVAVDCVTWDRVVQVVADWCDRHEGKCVYLCNVHSVITARSDPLLREALNTADLALPDGAPVAWFMRRRGCSGQERIGGPDLMARCCELAARRGYGVFLYGSTDETLARLKHALEKDYPGLRIVGAVSPPFRKLSPEELEADIRKINDSGAHMLFVALGCPKQEKLIHELKGRVRAVMFGFGAAFDFHSGRVRRAPDWMMKWGLEWLHRLAMDPRRLWKRYLVTNTAFVLLTARALLGAIFVRRERGG